MSVQDKVGWTEKDIQRRMQELLDENHVIYPNSSKNLVGLIKGGRPKQFFLKLTKENIGHIFKTPEAKEYFFMWLEKAVYNSLEE